MMAPDWIMDVFAVLMLAVAAVSAARLVAARPWRQADADTDTDAAHLLMGISMAGMLAVGLRTLPSGAWEVIFGAMTAWFAWRVLPEARREGARVLADGHYVPHLVHSAAMLYMFAGLGAASAGGGMSGMGAASGSAMQTLRLPALALLFALWLSAYVVLDLDRLSGPGHGHGSYFARMAIAPAGAGLVGASTAGQSPGAGVVTASAAASAVAAVPAAGGGVSSQRPAEPGNTRPEGTVTGSDENAARALLRSPQAAAACRIAMGLTMALMLVVMI
jgi:hypothetical protein